MSEPSTLHEAIQLVADALSPLGSAFAPGRAAGTLAELGIVALAGQASSVAAAAQPVAAASIALVEDAAALAQALADDDVGEAVARGASAVERVSTVVDGIDDLQAAVVGLGLPPDVANTFAERLFNLLLVRTLERGRGVNEILELLGVLTRQRLNEGSTDPTLPFHTVSTFAFSELGDWVSDPVGAVEARSTGGARVASTASICCAGSAPSSPPWERRRSSTRPVPRRCSTSCSSPSGRAPTSAHAVSVSTCGRAFRSRCLPSE